MKVWLYARLSRDEDDEMNSLNNQRQIVREYAEKMGSTRYSSRICRGLADTKPTRRCSLNTCGAMISA